MNMENVVAVKRNVINCSLRVSEVGLVTLQE
jgi:hypothetical protein